MENLSEQKIWLRATDLKQWLYCPRIVYYSYCMPLPHQPTAAMQRGRDLHERIEFLERRRKLRAYNLSSGERQFEVVLHSKQYGLSGKLDMLVTTAQGRYPVDFKMTRGEIGENHRLQLSAYAVMVEEIFSCKVETGFIYLIPHRNAVVVPIDAALRRCLFDSLAEIRALIAAERFPGATPVQARCWDCEFKNFCNDVF
ncbi:MAG: CRISPR-associated protein Cas4 [candidate division KSB1 bacterium]|nr:CRISPR-associated protein Cas4 [candidate division KSB1 bacterium]